MNLYLVGNQGLCSVWNQFQIPRSQVVSKNDLLNKRLKYLHNLLLNFKSKRLTMIKRDGAFFQCNSGDLVYVISLLTSQLHTASRKITIKYVGPVVIYKIRPTQLPIEDTGW